jgi:dihydroorotate dehydrogenase (NAD+) catalytic subunit
MLGPHTSTLYTGGAHPMTVLTPPDLSTTVNGIPFALPLLNASGAFYAPSFARFFQLNQGLGGIVTKTVTQQPSMGNRPYRTVELPGIGMLNSIGIQNPGLDACLNEEIASLAQHKLPVVLSLSAHSVAQFQAMALQAAEHPSAADIQALELNLSCPNVSAGGIHFGTDPSAVCDAVAAVKQVWAKPVWAKLTPNVTDIVTIGQAAVAGGADALTAVNTVMGLALDIKKRQPILPRVSGGYSGPGIRPIALHAVWQLHKAMPTVPIVGVGGIETAEDAISFLLAGASVVQVGTACFRHPLVFTQLVKDLSDYCQQENLTVKDLTGLAH